MERECDQTEGRSVCGRDASKRERTELELLTRDVYFVRERRYYSLF